jgi:hypothetical protein
MTGGLGGMAHPLQPYFPWLLHALAQGPQWVLRGFVS